MVGTRLIVVFVTAHFIPPAEFGVVALVLAVVEIAGVVADFGVDTLAIRDFAIIQDRQQQKVLASTILVTKLNLRHNCIHWNCIVFSFIATDSSSRNWCRTGNIGNNRSIGQTLSRLLSGTATGKKNCVAYNPD